MARRKLADIDLNLLVALDAVLIERSVTRAAKRLGVGHPAMSATLGRLRALLDDRLLVRTPQGMALTTRAAELRGPIAEILSQVEQVVGSSTPFNPLAAERTFVLCTTDYMGFVLLPSVLGFLRGTAPRMCLEVRGISEKRIADELSAGKADLGAGYIREAASGLYRQILFHERMICVVRADHPRVGRTLSLAEYAALPHALASPGGRGRHHADRVLAERGLDRRIVLRTRHFFAAAAAAAHTDLVATVPERLGRLLVNRLPLRILELPIELPSVPLVAVWHERMHRDPGHRWFRRTLAEVAATL